MRLVSQDGLIDVPYEISALSIGRMGESATIYVRSKLLDEKPCVFATYSNTDKALKVMEMLRNAYCGLPIIMKNVDISNEVIELLKDLKKNGIIFQKVEENPSVEYVDNTYFKFPDDSEVEV